MSKAAVEIRWGGNVADVATLRRFVRKDAEAAAALERVVSYNGALRDILGNAIGPALQATRDDLHRHYGEIEHKCNMMLATHDRVGEAAGVLQRLHGRANALLARAERVLAGAKALKKKAAKKGARRR